MEHWKLPRTSNLFVLMQGRKWCLRLVAAETPSTRALPVTHRRRNAIEVARLAERLLRRRFLGRARQEFVGGQKGATGAEETLLEAPGNGLPPVCGDDAPDAARPVRK